MLGSLCQWHQLKVPHPHGAVLMLGVLGCLAAGEPGLNTRSSLSFPQRIQPRGGDEPGDAAAELVAAGAIWRGGE